MKKVSVKLLLKHQIENEKNEPVEVYEEAIILVKTPEENRLEDKVEQYIASLNAAGQTVELVSILAFHEVDENEYPIQEVFSRFLSEAQVKAFY